MTKLDSSEAFRYFWYCLRFLGMHPFQTHKTIYKMYSVFITVTITFLATFEIVLQFFFVESFAHLMRTMSTSIELIGVSIKITVLFILRKKLLESHEYLKKLDERADGSPEDRQRMGQIVGNCRRIFFTFHILYSLTVVIYSITGVLNGRLIVDAWLPFDWKSSTKLYVIAICYQFFNSYYQCMMNLTSDFYSIAYPYVLLGHMECLAKRISNIGHDCGINSSEENYEELIRCVNDHRNTLSFFNSFSSVISGTIFVQFMGTACVLCMTGVLVLIDFNFIFTALSYLIAVLLEVLPCCYLVDQIIEASSNLTTAIYSCNWIDQDIKFRKAVIIFMQRTQQLNKILAGNMIPISLGTFVKLIRMTFSVFTLLSNL